MCTDASFENVHVSFAGWIKVQVEWRDFFCATQLTISKKARLVRMKARRHWNDCSIKSLQLHHVPVRMASHNAMGWDQIQRNRLTPFIVWIRNISTPSCLTFLWLHLWLVDCANHLLGQWRPHPVNKPSRRPVARNVRVSMLSLPACCLTTWMRSFWLNFLQAGRHCWWASELHVCRPKEVRGYYRCFAGGYSDRWHLAVGWLFITGKLLGP